MTAARVLTPRSQRRRFDLPNLGIGVGLRSVHYRHILDHWPKVGWFEAISENFLDTAGRPRQILQRIADRYPVVLHGVSLSIGGTGRLDRAYLRQLKKLADQVDACWVSDHVCWTGAGGFNLHDLLPLPYTEECLRHVVRRVRSVQDQLERPLVLENPSTYLEFRCSTMPEWEFLARLAEEADCGLLLDVNNVWVSARNHGFDPGEYLAGIPHHRVVQYHVAGHTLRDTHLIDTHSAPVINSVWRLFQDAWALTGERSVLLEWDADIPAFDVVHAEAQKARRFMRRRRPRPGTRRASSRVPALASGLRLADLQAWLHARIQGTSDSAPGHKPATAKDLVKESKTLSAASRVEIYQRMLRLRLNDCLRDDYPALAALLGPEAFDSLARRYLAAHPSVHWNLARLGAHLPEFLSRRIAVPRRALCRDVARLEAAMAEVFHLPSQAPVAVQDLGGWSGKDLERLRFTPVTALRLLRLEHPVNPLVSAALQDRALPESSRRRTWVAVYQRDGVVARLDLRRPAFLCLESLCSGSRLGDALDAAAGVCRGSAGEVQSQVKAWFELWLSEGLFAAVR